MTLFKVENIYASSATISSSFTAKLRQKSGSELAFVALSELSGEYEVSIDASGLTAGSEYTLTLESYNDISDEKLTLKTDTIVIRVTCQAIDQADINPFISAVAETLVIEAYKGSIQTASYSDTFDLVKQAFQLDLSAKTPCISDL